MRSSESVDVLTADAELLSSMFRTQVSENQKNLDERDAIAKERLHLQTLLRKEKQKNSFMKDELKKKETLILRAMAARQQMHEAYLAEKERVKEADVRMLKNEDTQQEIRSVVAGRDSEIRRLKN